MNPMTDMFDFNKNFEQFSKMMPDFANAGPMKAFTDMQAKYRAVAIEALNKNVELTTAWMTDAAKDATTLMTPETQPTAYAKKAGELAQAVRDRVPRARITQGPGVDPARHLRGACVIERARQDFGWSPRFTLEAGLADWLERLERAI